MIYSMIGFRDVETNGEDVRGASLAFAHKLRLRDHDQCIFDDLVVIREHELEGMVHYWAVAHYVRPSGQRFCESFAFWREL